jgi:hypothetical protein
MTLYHTIGLGQAITQKVQASSGPPEIVVIIAAGVFIALIGLGVLRGKMTPARRREEAQANSPRLEGRIVAVKRQTGFDRERSRVDIRVKLEYFDPADGIERTVFYVLDRNIKNLPTKISSPGAGITDLGAIIEKHREMKEKRKELETLGHTKEQIKSHLLEIALEQASHSVMEKDADGYFILTEPVTVDVYLNTERDNPENGIHVIFRSPHQL